MVQFLAVASDFCLLQNVHAYHRTPSSAEVKKEWSYTSSPHPVLSSTDRDYF
jgi:hypothetical protein